MTTQLAMPVPPAETAAAALEIFTVDKAHSEASFQVRHMLSKTRGRFTDFGGEIRLDRERPENSSVEFRVRAASIDTDVAERDQHLRSPDFFDVERYPEVVFRSRSIRPLGGDRYEVAGDFSMHGIARPILLPVALMGVAKDPWGGERAGFSTAITLDRKEFGIVWNAALDHGGFMLGDDVHVTIEVEAVRQSS